MAQSKYLSALKVEPNYTDALFNLGNLKYRLSSSVNLQSDSDSLNSTTFEKVQAAEGLSLMRKAAELGNLRAKQFLMEQGLLYENERNSIPLGPMSGLNTIQGIDFSRKFY